MNENNWNTSNNEDNNIYSGGMAFRATDPAQGLITASLILGVISIITTVMMTVYLPLIFGGIAIILAILSRGADGKLPKLSRTGVILAVIGILLDIAIICGSFYALFHNSVLRAQVNQAVEEIYGISFDDMLNDFSKNISVIGGEL